MGVWYYMVLILFEFVGDKVKIGYIGCFDCFSLFGGDLFVYKVE